MLLIAGDTIAADLRTTNWKLSLETRTTEFVSVIFWCLEVGWEFVFVCTVVEVTGRQFRFRFRLSIVVIVGKRKLIDMAIC